jgi:hypothetical protein
VFSLKNYRHSWSVQNGIKKYTGGAARHNNFVISFTKCASTASGRHRQYTKRLHCRQVKHSLYKKHISCSDLDDLKKLGKDIKVPKKQATPEPEPEPLPVPEPEPEPAPVAVTVAGCTHNSNCTLGKYCIEAECKTIADIYPEQQEGCTTCKVKEVEILTSDGEVYNLPPGQGSYTAASAIEWDTVGPPEYCQGTNVIVPIKVFKRNYGKTLADETILLQKGSKSDVITHPLIPSIAFTLELKDITEECS